MEIRYKLYPYPVLAYYSDDYVDSSFETLVDATKEGYGIKFDFIAELNNTELNNLITSQKAQFVYHFECAQTGYRCAMMTDKTDFSCVISNKNICGKLQICPFIVATEDLPNYINSCFHEDYRGFKFSIDSGCVMAVAKQVNVEIEKDINDLANTPSVFSIVKNADTEASGMVVDMDQKKIIIKLPEIDYYNFKSIKDEPSVQPVLNSLVIIPALTYVLEELSRRAADERYEYSEYNWYRTIKKTMATRFHCDIESDQLVELNMLNMAQKLINVPIAEALKALSTGYGQLGEEEDDE